MYDRKKQKDQDDQEKGSKGGQAGIRQDSGESDYNNDKPARDDSGSDDQLVETEEETRFP